MAKDLLFEDLNEPQREAIMHTGTPLLVLAGAGSGKTRVITRKFAYLVKKKKISPNSVFTVTFTNKAAEEMKGRIAELLHSDTKQTWIGTFHSQCNKILRREIRHLGYKSDFTIYDEEDQCSLIRHILKDLNIYEALYKGIASRISILKASLITPDKFLSDGDGFSFDEKVGRVYMRYQDELKKSDALDFDDLIMLTSILFKEHPKVQSKYQKMFEYILVDEFQDTNISQYKLLQQMVTGHGNICVVGDDDQSIYKFRGAEVSNIRNFQRDFPNHKIIKLEQNYRSTQNILDVSGTVIAGNLHRNQKRLWTEKGCGDKVCYCRLNTEDEEARFVARTIKEIYLKGLNEYSEIAVLYRINLQARAIEDGLRAEGIPYSIVSGLSFYHRREIKDIISYLKVIVNPDDNVSFRRIINSPPRGIGLTTISKLENEVKKGSTTIYGALKQILKSGNSVMSSIKERLSNFVKTIDGLREGSYRSAAELMKAIVNATKYLENLEDERVQNVWELIRSCENTSIQSFLDKTALASASEGQNGGSSVSLMTLHSAKGLEFSVVFLVGLEEGILPYFKAVDENADMEEERRLFYVGMTRARERLYLSNVRKRRFYSKVQDQEPSRFIEDIPREHCHWIEKGAQPVQTTAAIKQPIDTPKAYVIGGRVKHPCWGVGVVRACDGRGEDAKVTVNFPGIGVKRLAVRLANLESVNI